MLASGIGWFSLGPTPMLCQPLVELLWGLSQLARVKLTRRAALSAVISVRFMMVECWILFVICDESRVGRFPRKLHGVCDWGPWGVTLLWPRPV